MQRESFRGSFAPVKVGDELDVKIEAVGEKGDGIAKAEGFVLFIPNTKEGDEVKIRVTRVLRKVGFAEVIGGSEAEPKEEGQAEESGEDTQQPEQSKEESTAEQSEGEVKDTEDFGEELEKKE